MIEKDYSRQMVETEVEMCKKSTMLYGENQYQRESGHESADYGGGPPQSAAGGSPGTQKPYGKPMGGKSMKY